MRLGDKLQYYIAKKCVKKVAVQVRLREDLHREIQAKLVERGMSWSGAVEALLELWKDHDNTPSDDATDNISRLRTARKTGAY